MNNFETGMLLLLLVSLIGLSNSNNSYPDFVFDQDLFADSPPIRTEYFPPGDCQIREGCVVESGERTIIRFITGIANIGNATWNVGNPAYSDLAVWDNCHDHYHIDNYVEYDIFAADDITETTALTEGGKEGICFQDGWSFAGYNGSLPKESSQFSNCSYQGIGIGRMDIYANHIICQFVDITDLPAGEYVLRGHVNPDKITPELNHDNNYARVQFNYTGNQSDYYISQYTPNRTDIDAWISYKNDLLTGWGTNYSGIMNWYSLYGYNVPVKNFGGSGGNLYGWDTEFCFSPGPCFSGTNFTDEISPGIPTLMNEFSIELNYDSVVYGKGYFYIEGDWRVVSKKGCVYPNVTTEFYVYFVIGNDNNSHIIREVMIAGDQNTFTSFQERVFFMDWDCNAANDPFYYVADIITPQPTKETTKIPTIITPQPTKVLTNEPTKVPTSKSTTDGAHTKCNIVNIILLLVAMLISIN